MSATVFTDMTMDMATTLLEMVGFAANGRCMACGWPLAESADKGCVQGNCSFRPSERDTEYGRWWTRTQTLTFAREYANGNVQFRPFGLPSGADLDTIAEERKSEKKT